jgi:hypothetical protein
MGREFMGGCSEISGWHPVSNDGQEDAQDFKL